MQGTESRLFRKAYAEWRQGVRHISISPGDIVLFDYREYVREKLKKRPEKFWVSPDIATIKGTTLEPNSVTFVPVHIPFPMSPFTDFHPYAFSCAYATTRSRFAQLGVEVNVNAGVGIAETASPVDENDQYKGLLASIAVVNQAERVIRLPESTKFFYLYYWDRSTINGRALQGLIGSKIRIKGEEHKDFRLWYGPIPTGREEDVKGIEFFLDPQSRSWIPPHPEPVTIDDNSAGNHNRSTVDRFLMKPIPKSQDRTIFWVAETLAELELESSIHGLIDRAVSDNNSFDFQTNSVLFRGGNTYGRMRTEIRSRTEDHLIPQTVLMRFAWA